jgi:hypothetical protein
VQGIGYLTSEKLVFENDGPEIGRLTTDNTWRYKPPATTSIPQSGGCLRRRFFQACQIYPDEGLCRGNVCLDDEFPSAGEAEVGSGGDRPAKE